MTALALALAWCGLAARALLAPQPLPDLPLAEASAVAPVVSVLVAVRNEMGRCLDRSLSSQLDQAAGVLEVIAVDDHSEDGSLARLLELGRTSPRLRVERAALEGRGKRAALAQAERGASGSWLLFTDADVVLAPDAVARGLALAQREGLDALSLLPRTRVVSFWEQVALAAISWVVYAPWGLARCNDDRAPVGLAAAGPYLLVRRSAYGAIGGYEEIDQEVLLDVALARRLREAGLRYRYFRSGGCVTTRMYGSLAEIWRGFAKNAFAAVDWRPGRAALSSLGLGAVALPLPLVGAGLARVDVAGVSFALTAVAAMAVAQSRAASFMGARLRPLPLLLVSLGAALWGGILGFSAWRSLSGRGVAWKGRVVGRSRGRRHLDVAGHR